MIIISPYSRKLRSGKDNPKNYPYWNELIEMILDVYPKQKIIQVGVNGEKKLNHTEVLFDKKLDDLKLLLNVCDYWISVDNFFHHLVSLTGKKGIVIFGQSDPNIFGNPININVLEDRKYLRHNQFDLWESTEYKKESFTPPDKILEIIKENF